MKKRIAFVIPSNRPVTLRRFIKSLDNSPWIVENSIFVFVIQEPVYDWDLKDWLKSNVDHKITLIDSFKTNPKPMLQLRRHGLQNISIMDSDYICFLDDDHQFVSERPEKNYPMSSDEFYRTSCEWLDANLDVGILSQRGYFGGYAWGYKPEKNPSNGLIENEAGGILFRNISINTTFPEECWNFVGVMSEPLVGYNIMAAGYNFAKRFNCPNKFDKPGKTKHVESSGSNITYSEQVANENAQGYIRKKFNDPIWRHSNKKYPKDIAKRIGK